MKRIDRNTVELTEDELAARQLYEELLDNGLTCPQAAREIDIATNEELDPAFIVYLREG